MCEVGGCTRRGKDCMQHFLRSMLKIRLPLLYCDWII